ncbi:saccharopine dehydrogenase family protein [Patulibacter minatonensis]|uniref:saccharopine dehydrogenase family protein n=1 Tax=Patulibacter minatonensis TaxID=298163 RepID=UPI00047EF85A|nr:saccharopine dehydrogenase NADP-binding domain-containing protein [Patulibacter minatonensis]
MKIAVYGAGGYTGRLVAARVRAKGAEPVLVGRGTERLRHAASAAGVEGAELRTAGLDDPDALARALDGCAAVVNCAGPFTRLGEPVVRAAIAAGCHYVDTTAEQLYIQRIFDTCGVDAASAGVTVIPAMGYDIVPGDLLCHLVGTAVAPVQRLTLAYDIRDFGMTRGSARSVLEMYTGGEVAYRAGTWAPGGGPTRRDPVVFPGETRPAKTVRWPAGEIVTVPRHLEVREVDVVMRADALVPSPVSVVAPSLMPIMTAVMRTPLGRGLDKLVGRLPEGPSEEQRRKARFGFVAEATGTDGRTSRGVLQGEDVYGSTAAIAVEGATRLAGGGSAAGVLAPSQAFDPEDLLAALAGDGITWSVDGPS